VAGKGSRSWDGARYHAVAAVMDGMASETLARLDLTGHETVLDAGCGSGRTTLRLLERLPRGRVIAVDASPSMIEQARANLPPDRVSVRLVDLLELELEAPVDAIFSTAALHWILDHERLFSRLFAALRPGGKLVAQCGGDGNLHTLLGFALGVAVEPEYAPRFVGFSRGTHFATPEDTERRLREAGFVDARAWLQGFPVAPEDPLEYLEILALGPLVQRLAEHERRGFVERVAERMPKPIVADYVRLNLAAVKPG
jgi:trans-aconitate 2-methyltransferase